MRPWPSTVIKRTRNGRPYSLRPCSARIALAASSTLEYSTKQNLPMGNGMHLQRKARAARKIIAHQPLRPKLYLGMSTRFSRLNVRSLHRSWAVQHLLCDDCQVRTGHPLGQSPPPQRTRRMAKWPAKISNWGFGDARTTRL